MDTSSHGPGVDDAKVPKRAATSPGRDDPVPETVASAPALLSLTDEGKKEAVTGQGKSQQQQRPALKKPDKVAPCPRCDSLDTKFCYYNNYNVNQPRHFCKSCQRYWTAGGTLRNVPVGAGRRKNKHGSLQARHGGLPEQQVRLEPSLGVVAQPRPRSQSVPDQISPPLASSSSDRSSQERGVSSGAVTHASSIRNTESARRQYIPEPQTSISSDHGGSRLHKAEHGASCDPEAEKEDCAEVCTSSAPGYSSEMDGATPTAQEVESTIRVPAATALQPVVSGVVRGLGVVDGSVWTAAPAPFGLFNGSWPFGYNVGWSGPPPGTPGTPICPPGGALVACQPAVGGITTWPAPPNGLALPTWPGVCWGSTLIPGMPPGLVGSPWMSPGWGGGWSMPWAGPPEAAAAASASMQAAAAAATPSTPSTPSVSNRLPIRPVLSKHPRDRLELERVESSLWVPKMVRLEDPGNIPRSSVWTAVGADNRLDAPGSNFKAFLPVRNNNNDKAPSITSSGVFYSLVYAVSSIWWITVRWIFEAGVAILTWNMYRDSETPQEESRPRSLLFFTFVTIGGHFLSTSLLVLDAGLSFDLPTEFCFCGEWWMDLGDLVLEVFYSQSERLILVIMARK